MTPTLLSLLIAILFITSTSFHLPHPPPTPLHLHSTAPITSPIYIPLYKPPKSISFQRIDDVIMGGVSKSRLTDIESNSESKSVPSSHMKFSGILRTLDGGFCGFRTLPFSSPLNCSGFTGVYMRLRFTSDVDVGKRTFKITLRDDDTRGEYVFQRMFTIPESSSSWIDVKVPFEELVPVRGPVINKEGRNFNVSNVMQIGVVVSKFVISEKMQSISDFRPGYFSMDFNEIGFYTISPTSNSPPPPPQPQSSNFRPSPLVSLFSSFFKLFFNEGSRRRRAAYIAARDRTGKGWFHVARMGFKGRKKNYGLINAVVTYAGRVAMDGFKGVLGWTFKLAVFYPVRTAFRIKKKIMGGGEKGEIA